MKNSWYILSFIIVLFSCQKKEGAKEKKSPVKTEAKSYAIISGTIKNSKEDYFIFLGKHINQRIDLREDGSFLDTLKISVVTTNGIKINKTQIPIYIKNGDNLNITADLNNFPESISYNGIGAIENTYLLAQYMYGLNQGRSSDTSIYQLDQESFNKKIEEYKIGLDSIDGLYQNINPNLLELTKKQNIKSIGFIQNLYKTTKASFKNQREVLKKLVKGVPSPKFTNYENQHGKLVSLDDFKGNYVFIEVWGTWIKEYTENSKILNDFKGKYAHKNIRFITLCADNKASSGTISFAKQKWKNAIEKNNLNGNHLFIGNDRQFLIDYQILTLPRYILIDPKGKIIDAQAPSPIKPELTKLFNTLNLK
ncbi:TlpA family protein disulfide reductase [Polaribacter pectinis]|uniref:TlpA family protein disulfide reductase n=1 Tax=Polaribacter pectinis TaxID=2738844 RepID=A0A7G9LBH0_9FLAO|nr:TlpA disulfide reductase family protein [Polaribacter pectinis]QNM85969.1 TlpA family protein disulfide reductase [Polaribacter pectinis]